jgi:hypothetical protein
MPRRRREGERVALVQDDLLAGHVEAHLPGQHEYELHVRRQRVGLGAAAAAGLDLAEDGLDPLLAGRREQVLAYPGAAEVDGRVGAAPNDLTSAVSAVLTR